ncbi:MAG: glycosyltransferase family 4 protein [Gaiellaceae bacterium]
MSDRPRLLIVGRSRYRLPLDDSLRRKFDALGEALDVRVIGTALSDGGGDATFRLVRRRRPAVLDGALFYASLPRVVASELRAHRPDAVLTQSAYEAAAVLIARAVARSDARLIVDVHGDWDTATELYGSRLRRVLSPVTTRVSRAALRRADAVRTISEFTSDLVRREGVEPAHVFPAYVDFGTFSERPPEPPPERPRALFVGVLERYKNVDGLAAAWRRVHEREPDVGLVIVGSGRERAIVERLVAEVPGVTWHERLTHDEVALALDDATLLVLPSRSEGLPRIVIEAFCRGRPVVGARAGGIPDIVEDDVNGVLVPAGDPDALADALVTVLTDGALQRRLADGARASAERWLQTPEEYAARIRELVARASAA